MIDKKLKAEKAMHFQNSVIFSFGLVVILAFGAASRGVAQGEPIVAETTPVGFVTIEAAAGLGGSKKNTLLSIPLLGDDGLDVAAGVVSSVADAQTIEVQTSRDLVVGELSDPGAPYLVKFTSGDAEGHMFLVSTIVPNGVRTITLEDRTGGVLDLNELGVKTGDRYHIYPCDTLLSFFGTPATTGILGGAAAKDADTVVMVVNGSASTYYFDTTVGYWRRVGLGAPRSDNVPLLPYYGVQYGRLAPTALTLVSYGQVPTGPREVRVKGRGVTLVSSYWPVDIKLKDTGLNLMPNWMSGGNGSESDRVVTTTNGAAATFFHDGGGWKKVGLGSPVSDEENVKAGSAMMVNRAIVRGVTRDDSFLRQNPPYILGGGQ